MEVVVGGAIKCPRKDGMNMWKCPECGSKDDLQVYISVWANLNQPDYDPEAFETDIDGQDHEFSPHSGAQCTACGCNGNLEKFDIGDPDDDEDDEDDERRKDEEE